jgi:hypothetical protein
MEPARVPLSWLESLSTQRSNNRISSWGQLLGKSFCCSTQRQAAVLPVRSARIVFRFRTFVKENFALRRKKKHFNFKQLAGKTARSGPLG